MQESSLDYFVCCEPMDSSGNLPVAQTCTSIENKPLLPPEITEISAHCAFPEPIVSSYSSNSSLALENSANSTDGDTETLSPPESAENQAEPDAESTHAALSLSISTSVPSSVWYMIVAPVHNTFVPYNSSVFMRSVHDANLTSSDVIAGTLAGQSNLKGLDIVHLGSAFTKVQHTLTESLNASVKVTTCHIDVNTPLALLVAAENPSRGMSTLLVHDLNHLMNCQPSDHEQPGGFQVLAHLL